MIKSSTLLGALKGVKRYEGNPITSPTSDNGTFANYGVYNGDVFFHDGIYHGVFRCESISKRNKTSSTVGHYTSRNGEEFVFDRIIIQDDRLSIDDPRIFRHNEYFYITSTQVDPEKSRQTLHLTKTKDFKNFDFLGSLKRRDGEPYLDHKGIRAFVPVVND